MKFLVLLATSFLSIYAFSQNVGIGTTNPGERLDVNGNINLTGTIKTNGVDGSTGQVLMKNSSGNLVWGDMSEFRNLSTFTAQGSGTWTVPAGITRVWVEVWAAGGGGNQYGGGGGGGYISAVFTVAPGTTVSYTVGGGGAGGTTSSTAGGNSVASYVPQALTLTAFGGAVASLSSSFVLYSTGGSFSVSGAGFTAFRGMNGQPGRILQPTSYQYNATTFIESCFAGEGGNGGNTSDTGGKGAVFIHNTSTNTLIRSGFGTGGIVPGGGGGSGYAAIIPGASLGFAAGPGGAGGMVIIHY